MRVRVPSPGTAGSALGRLASVTAMAFAVMGLSGCTVYPDKNPPTLATTTSAEQVQRIFWQDVEQAKWAQANALLAPNAVWRVGDRVIDRGQIVPWLQSLGVKAVQVSNVTLQPAVNDINLIYTVQLQAAQPIVSPPVGSACGSPSQAPAPTTTSGTSPTASGISPQALGTATPQTLSALAVWQQPQPTGKPTKDKDYHGYLLTVHDLTAIAANSACR